MSYLGNSPQQKFAQKYFYTATAGQTTFTGTDIYGLTLRYDDSKYIDVYLNGAKLQINEDYTAPNKTSVVLTSGAQLGDIVEIDAQGIFSIADTVSASAGGTFGASINVNSNFNVTGNLSVLSSNLIVGGMNVTSTLNSAFTKANTSVQNNATTQITTGYTYKSFNAGSNVAAFITWTPNAANGNYQYANTNGPFTIAAPASDSAMDIILTNGASAGSITFSGYTVQSGGTGDTYATTNANRYLLSIRRIFGISTYVWKALQ
jgi:hypothetical protein